MMLFRKLLVAAFAIFLTSFAALTHATPISFSTTLSGASESPSNSSTASGTAAVIFDLDTHLMNVHVDFRGLASVSVAAHIHCCTSSPGVANAGVATEISLSTLGSTAGFYDQVFDLTKATSFGAAFLAANGGNVAQAELALLNGSLQGRSYVNVHSSAFPAGEIRGFLQSTAQVPLPSSLLLLGLGCVGLLNRVRNQVFA
jgi:CHRD domain/PEP-CTERM motif